MNLEKKIIKVNELVMSIDENKEFLELLKLGNKYYRDGERNATDLTKLNKFIQLNLSAQIWDEDGLGSNNKFGSTHDQSLMKNLQQIMIERTEKHIEMQKEKLKSFFK